MGSVAEVRGAQVRGAQVRGAQVRGAEVPAASVPARAVPAPALPTAAAAGSGPTLDGTSFGGRVAGAEHASSEEFAAECAAMDAAIATLRECDRACAVASAALMQALLTVADLTGQPRFEADHAAWVLAWSPRHASGEIAWGRQLINHLPAVWAAWQDGEIDGYRALIFVQVLEPCFDAAPELARAIADDVLPGAGRVTGPRLRQKLRRLLQRGRPEAMAKRVQLTEQQRDVYLTPADDGGTAAVTGVHLPAARAAAAFERVDAIARARRAAGDDRTLAQLRAETFCDLLDGTGLGVSPIARPGSIELTIPLATALSVGSEPADLVGYGPVVADIARQIAAANQDVQWRFSVTRDGELLYAGVTDARPGSRRPAERRLAPPETVRPQLAPPETVRSGLVLRPRPPAEADARVRMPGAALRRWICVRDRRCQAPGCNAPARACDLDHTIDYAGGGKTVHGNLALLCRRHHRLKHLGILRVVQVRPGLLLWITRTGHVFWRDD
jgi:hypothetical protein